MRTTFILVLSLLIISGCTEPESTLLPITNEGVTGTWKAARFISTIPGLTEEQQKGGEQEFLSSIYTLRTDHSFNLTSETFAAGANGRWELDPNTKLLTMSYEMGGERGVEEFTVEALKKDTMTLRIDIPDMQAFIQLKLSRMQ